MPELTDAQLKKELTAFLLSEGATPTQAKKLVKIVFAEVEKGKQAGAVLEKMGYRFSPRRDAGH